MASSSSTNTTALVPQGKHAQQPAIPIVRPATILGARHQSHVHLLSRSVSKSHAAIIKTSRGCYIRDLASRTHLYVNGTQAHETDLNNDDLLKIGNFVFKFEQSDTKGDSTANLHAPAGQFETAGSAPIVIHSRTMLLGSRPECDLSLLETSVSSAHALVFELDDKWVLRDLSSRTGTFLNGKQIHQKELRFGDEIRVGETTFHFNAAGATSPDLNELVDSAAPIGVAADSDKLIPIEEDIENLGHIPTPEEIEADLHGSLYLPAEEDQQVEPGPPPLAVEEPVTAPIDQENTTDAKPPEAASESTDVPLPLEPVETAPEPSTATSKITPPASATPASSVSEPGSGVMAPMGVLEAERRRTPRPPTEKTPAALPPQPPLADLIELDHEIDLASDPDVSGPADTATLKPSPEKTPTTPELSERVIDTVETPDSEEGQRLLVDADLHAEAFTNSGEKKGHDDSIFAHTNDDSHAPAAPGKMGVDEIELTDEASPLQLQVPEVELGPRGGWHQRQPAALEPTPSIAPAADQPVAPPAEEAKAPPIAVEAEPVVEDETTEESSAPAIRIESTEQSAPPDEPAGEPQSVDELAHLDFSDIDLPTPPKVEEPVELDLSDDQSVSPTEPPLDLGLSQPVDEKTKTSDEVIEPLIGPGAIAPQPLDAPKSKRSRKGSKSKPVQSATDTSPAEPPASRKRGKKTAQSPVDQPVQTLSKAAIPSDNDDRTEIVDRTEPSPESALSLDDAVKPDDVETIEPSPLTDTSFGRQIDDFSADAPEPIIEEEIKETVDAGLKAPVETEVESPDESQANEQPAQASTAPPAETSAASTDIPTDEALTVRPQNALERIAASFTATDLSEAEESVSTSAAKQAESTPAADVSTPPVEPNTEPSNEQAAGKVAEQAAPAGAHADGWTLPDESDLLVPDESTDHPGVDFVGDAPTSDSSPMKAEEPDLNKDDSLRLDDLSDTGMDGLPTTPPPPEPPVFRRKEEPIPAAAPKTAAPPVQEVASNEPATATSAPKVQPPPAKAPAIKERPTATEPPGTRLPPRPSQMGRRPAPGAPGAPRNTGPLPFATSGPVTFGRATTAFDGLAMPPVRETDVFSQHVQGHFPANDGKDISPDARPNQPVPPPGLGAAAAHGAVQNPDEAGRETLPYASIHKGTTRPPRSTAPGFRPPTAGAHPDEHPKRRRKGFGLKFLLPMMLLAIIATALGIYHFVQVVHPIEGFIDYNNLAKAPAEEQAQIRQAQIDLVQNQVVRSQAADILRNRHSDTPLGYLDGSADGLIEFKKNVSAYFPSDANRMIIRWQSTDPTRDVYRMEALLTAIETANKTSMNDHAARLNGLEEEARSKSRSAEKTYLEKAAQLTEAKRLGAQRPSGEEESALEAQNEANEAAFATASAQVLTLKAELAGLTAKYNPAGDSTQPASADNSIRQQIADKQAELATAQQAADKAHDAAIATGEKLLKMATAKQAAINAGNTQQQLETELAAAATARQKAEEDLAAAKNAADAAVTVVPYAGTQVNIKVDNVNDPRMLYVAVTTISIWLIFVGLVYMNLRHWRRPAIDTASALHGNLPTESAAALHADHSSTESDIAPDEPNAPADEPSESVGLDETIDPMEQAALDDPSVNGSPLVDDETSIRRPEPDHV